MSDPYFFGYGSLVNRTTHSYPQAVAAHVRGWRRAWRGTGLRGIAYLTAEPDPGGEITGLIAAVPRGDWAALDLREAAYARHRVETIRHGAGERDLDIQIYAVEPQHMTPVDHPILLSYLDTVIQGILVELGEAGARDFFDTTTGWHHPVHADRAVPTYPRATVLSAHETAFVAAHLARVRP